jgi:NAD(P)-dependent dehydrogenase (short-subunit alcohol dehydrogenase family)
MTEKDIHELGKSSPLGRIAKIEEVVDSILFLCSDEASYITGTALDVNGGQL